MSSSCESPCPASKRVKVTSIHQVSLQASEEYRHPAPVMNLPGKVSAATVSHVEGNDDLLLEILKHVDAQTLAFSSCVNRRWRKAAENQILWENICTRNWPATFSRPHQLKSVVTALGGFRRLYAMCLHPLLLRHEQLPLQESLYPSTSSSVFHKVRGGSKWGRDEVHLSLSLFSIDCYERLSNISSLDLLRRAPSLLKTVGKCNVVRSFGDDREKIVEGRTRMAAGRASQVKSSVVVGVNETPSVIRSFDDDREKIVEGRTRMAAGRGSQVKSSVVVGVNETPSVPRAERNP